MKEIKNEVEITEENYKGYIELYKYKVDPYSDPFMKPISINIFKISGLYIITMILGIDMFSSNEILFEILFTSYLIGVPFYVIKAVNSFVKININDILNEYPNIENIDINNLRKSLEKVGLLKENELDVKGYETKLKGNKIIEETINEQRYEYRDLTADYVIPEKEQEKVKVRKLYR